MCGWSKLEKRGLEKEGLNEFYNTCGKKCEMWTPGGNYKETSHRTKPSCKTIFFYNLIICTFIYLENMEMSEVFIPSIISSTTATITIMVDFRTKIK
jgi:hypothetical protein